MASSYMPAQGYREDEGLYLESDTDEQLLIHIPFNQGVLPLASHTHGPGVIAWQDASPILCRSALALSDKLYVAANDLKAFVLSDPPLEDLLLLQLLSLAHGPSEAQAAKGMHPEE